MLAQDEITVLGGGGGGELEHQRQVVGQLVALDLETGGAVELLHSQQRQPSLAAVTERVEGHIQPGAFVQIERAHVVLGELEGGRLCEPREEPSDRIRRPPGRKLRHLGRELVATGDQLGVWVLEREGAELVGARTLGLPTDGAARQRASLLRSWAILMMSSSTGSSVSMNSP